MRHPIPLWERQLTAQLKEIEQKQHFNLKELDQLLVIINNLSLICFYTNNTADAYHICHHAIDYFYHYTQYDKEINPSEYQSRILQPFINIIRLDRFSKKYDQSLKNLEDFNPFTDSNYIKIQDKKILKEHLKETDLNLIKNCYIEETFKTYLAQAEYKEGFGFVNNLMNFDIKGPYQYFLLEGYLIGLYFLQGPQVALDYLTDYFSKIDPSFSHIFLVKLALLLYRAGEKDQARQIILSVYHQYKKTIPTLNGEGLRFCLYLAYFLKEIECEAELIIMIKALYDRYDAAQDELSKIECLALVKDFPDFQVLWNSLLSKSLYLIITRKYISSTLEPPIFSSVSQLLNLLKGSSYV